MDDEVTKFEESILYFADAYNVHGPGSRRNSTTTSPFENTPLSSGSATPALTPGSSVASSRASSFAADQVRRPSFGTRLGSMLRMSVMPETQVYESTFDEAVDGVNSELVRNEFNPKALKHELEAWQLEAAGVDRSVRILPGVKRMMDSIPAGRYAVATSGAKTYG